MIINEFYKNAFALLVSKASFLGLRVILLYVSALQLDKESFGLMALAFTTAELCRYLCDWGTDAWSIREFSNPEKDIAISKLLFVIKIRAIGSTIAIMLTWGIIDIFFPIVNKNVQLAISLTAGTSLWINLGVNFLQAQSKLRAVYIYIASASIACMGLFSFVFVCKYPPENLVYILVVSEIVMCLGVLFYIFGRLIHNSKPQAITLTFIGESRNWLKQCTPIALATSMSLVYGRYDQYFIGHKAIFSHLAEYILSQKIVEPILFLFISLTSTIYVKTSQFIHINGLGVLSKNFAFKWIGRVFSLALFLCIVFAICLRLYQDAFASKYIEIYPLIYIILVSVFFRIMNQCFTVIIQATGEYSKMMHLNLFYMVIFIGLISWLGNVYGVIGVAWAICIGELIAAITQAAFIVKKFNV